MLGSLRLAILWLLIAGLVNFTAFHLHIKPLPGRQANTSLSNANFEVAGGLLAISFLVIACWFALLPLLELITWKIQASFAPSDDPARWVGALYSSLKPAGLLAFLGMTLWALWVYGFYYLRVNFFVISYAIGIPIHILAACLYVPLLFRWYKLMAK